MALYYVIVTPAVYSGLFMVTSQVAHLLPHTAHASSPNFYKHQLCTSQDFAPTPADSAPLWKKIHSKLTFYASGGLNMQVEHHLFPGVNHCHLGALHQRVVAVCKKHGIAHYAATGYVDAVRQHFAHTRDMSVNPALKEAVHSMK
jgi:delta11-fatty-acid desaturase